jgi:glycosyltransferase involved in cell wall biosynthesis
VRILMLSEFYHPFVGGIEQHVRNLSIDLVRRGHEVSVATLWHEGQSEFEVDEGVRIYRLRSTMARVSRRLGAGRNYAPPAPDPETVLELRWLAARLRPDVVHAHNWLVHSYLPLKASVGAPLVMSLHTHGLACAKHNLLHGGGMCDGPRLDKCLGCGVAAYGVAKGVPIVTGRFATGNAERRLVDRFLPVSRAVAVGNGLVESGVPYEVVPNFVPDDVDVVRGDFAEYEAQLPSEPFLLFVGAFGRHKGEHVLLKAYEGLASPPPLVLIGYTPSGEPMRFPPNVTVLKNWPRDAVMRAWRRSLLGLAPSVWIEPCATVVMEAMATGRPVVASHVGGMPDMVADGETGLLVPPGDADALRAAIARLLADAPLRERMGRAARERVVRFQASAVVPRIEGIYAELVERRSPAPRLGVAPRAPEPARVGESA